MKIYTKQGDAGVTQVYTRDVRKVAKDDVILDAYGSLDELNAQLGLLASQLRTDHALASVTTLLTDVQRDLFTIGFAISDSSQLANERVVVLENGIDSMQQDLPPQTQFILPGGSQAAAHAHVCRTVCRRAERALVRLHHEQEVASEALQYLNRLSDYLFVLARWCNLRLGITDINV